MPPELQVQLIGRIATIDVPDEEIIRDVEAAIERRLNGEKGGCSPFEQASADSPPGMTSLVKMLGAMRPADQRRLLGEIAQADVELLGGIRRAMFGADVAGCETACG